MMKNIKFKNIYVCTSKHQVNNKNSLHKWENLLTDYVLNGNKVRWDFQKYERTMTLLLFLGGNTVKFK